MIIIKLNNKEYTLTSLREDFKQDGRYTKVRYVKSIKKDCLRRDLTFNALYMDSNQKVYDFNNGLEHLENSKIIFIGDFKKSAWKIIFVLYVLSDFVHYLNLQYTQVNI